MFWFKHANTRKHINEHSWLFGSVMLNILAHLTHLAQSYFFLIFSAINTYNCFWFDLTNRKICSDWKQKLGEKWPTLTTFFLTATAAITGNSCSSTRPDTRQDSRGWLGRSGNAKNYTRFRNVMDGRIDGPTDRPTWQGVESRVRD